MTKIQHKQAVLAKIEALLLMASTNINNMSGEAANPQISKMITKNQGYMLALADMREFLRSSAMR